MDDMMNIVWIKNPGVLLGALGSCGILRFAVGSQSQYHVQESNSTCWWSRNVECCTKNSNWNCWIDNKWGRSILLMKISLREGQRRWQIFRFEAHQNLSITIYPTSHIAPGASICTLNASVFSPPVPAVVREVLGCSEHNRTSASIRDCPSQSIQ